jgi:hypothetical protein
MTKDLLMYDQLNVALSIFHICIGWAQNHSTKIKYNRLSRTFSQQKDVIVLFFFFFQTIESSAYAKLGYITLK